MKTKYVILLLICGGLWSCSSTKTKANQEQLTALEQLVTERSFEISSDWALPQATNSMVAIQNSGLIPPGSSSTSINLIGNPNYLKMFNDSVQSYLPYFGERQIINSYGGSDSAIEFDGLINDYTLKKNKNQSYTMEFKANSHGENFNVSIQIFPNLTTEIILNSAKRFMIRYRGRIVSISE